MHDLQWIVRRIDAGRWVYYAGLNHMFTGPRWVESAAGAYVFVQRRSAEDVARLWGGYVQARPDAA